MAKSWQKNTLKDKELHQLYDASDKIDNLDVSNALPEEKIAVEGLKKAIHSCGMAEEERRHPIRLTNRSIWDHSQGNKGIAAWGRGPTRPFLSSLLTIKSFVDVYSKSEPSTPLQSQLKEIAQTPVFAKLVSFIASYDVEASKGASR